MLWISPHAKLTVPSSTEPHFRVPDSPLFSGVTSAKLPLHSLSPSSLTASVNVFMGSAGCSTRECLLPLILIKTNTEQLPRLGTASMHFISLPYLVLINIDLIELLLLSPPSQVRKLSEATSPGPCDLAVSSKDWENIINTGHPPLQMGSRRVEC